MAMKVTPITQSVFSGFDQMFHYCGVLCITGFGVLLTENHGVEAPFLMVAILDFAYSAFLSALRMSGRLIQLN
jgi:hypothetical protein